jgi:hypothetical protein
MKNPTAWQQAYWEKLKDPRWQMRRLEIFKRDGASCQECGNAEEELQVHHRYYIKGREPWEYPDGCLVTLCKTCHSTRKMCDPAESEMWEQMLEFFVGRSDYENAHGWSLMEQIDNFQKTNGMSKIDAFELLTTFLKDHGPVVFDSLGIKSHELTPA